MEEKTSKMLMTNRQKLQLEGVEHVASFDEEEITLETDLGMLVLKGKGLHITQLNLEVGNLAVEGLIFSIDYIEEKGVKGLRSRGKGLLDKILK